jgi:hypothetical protein
MKNIAHQTKCKITMKRKNEIINNISRRNNENERNNESIGEMKETGEEMAAKSAAAKMKKIIESIARSVAAAGENGNGVKMKMK